MKNLGNILIIGDSYSTFEGCIPEGYSTYYPGADVTSPEQTWWRILTEKSGSNLVLNNSYSGTTICHTGYGGEDCSKRSFSARAEKLIEDGFFTDNKIDTILIFGATNDSWANSPLGKSEFNGDKKELYFVLPAADYLIDRLKKNSGGARIVFIVNTELREKVASGIKAILKKHGIEYIELCGIDKVDGHPTALGMKQIAEQIEMNI